MINQILWLDHQWFEWVQTNLRHASFNTFFVLCRDKMFWIPLYIFIFCWVWIRYFTLRWRIFFAVIVLIALTDQINSSFLKKNFKRDRPCREMYFKDHFEPLVRCGVGYSFPSSHAANHMAIGSFLFLLFARSMRRWRYFFLYWPILIGFSQVYVGVHFPIDVMVGSLVGITIGSIVYSIYTFSLKYGFTTSTIRS